ncbi:hypothetical protein ACFWA9_17920 [Kitasatospora sp. NPDC059973]|uniref:hypothetical protein n=1 Tax=Kitasatospora sp. NPDC059973 TaxID=3347020 RepID=UPI0036A33A66
MTAPGTPLPVRDPHASGPAPTGDAAGGIVRVDRYSTRPDPPAVRYGATLECRVGWKLFLSCDGTARPGHPRPEQPYQTLSHI